MTNLVVCSTFGELAPFFESNLFLEEKKFFQPGSSLFSGKIGKNKVDILISGPGILNCTFALASYMAQKKPSRIFQIGIAGVFGKSGLGIGDIVVADDVQYLHSGVENADQLILPLPFELIENRPETSFGRYLSDSGIGHICLEKLKQTRSGMLNESFKVEQGKIITVSMITGSIRRACAIEKEFSPLMEAMEGAGSAHAAALYGIPMVEIRSGSNMVGDRDKSRWDIPLASERISWVLESIMKINYWE